MKNYILSFLLLSYSILFSQNIQLINNIDKSIIPYANATYFYNNEIVGGDYTDINGYLDVKLDKKIDRIEFSAIDYLNLKINLPINTEKIYLLPMAYILNEVVVTNNEKYESLGLADENKKYNLGIGKGLEEVLFIENKSKKTLIIKSFLFRIKKVNNKIAVRVHFYSLNPNKFEPKDELLTKNIIYYLEEKTKGIVEINVQEYGIELPKEGAFVGIEALGVVNEIDGSFDDEVDYRKDLLSFEVNYAINKPISFIRNRYKNNYTGYCCFIL